MPVDKKCHEFCPTASELYPTFLATVPGLTVGECECQTSLIQDILQLVFESEPRESTFPHWWPWTSLGYRAHHCLPKSKHGGCGVLDFKPMTPVSALHGNAPSFLGPLGLMLNIFKCSPKRFSRGCFFSTVWTLNMQIIVITLPTLTHVCEHRVKSWQRSNHL